MRGFGFWGVVGVYLVTLGHLPTSSAAQSDVRTILNQRCVVCHSCYDAPCQLKLTSTEGILRGGSKTPVYHSQRLTDAPPTRLGIDAKTIAGWRALGFHSIAPGADPSAPGTSLLEQYLKLGRQNTLPANAQLPKEVELGLDRPLACPTTSEFEAFQKNHPLAGMPYGTAPLSDEEYDTLISWAVGETAWSEPSLHLTETIRQQITDWETFLNQPDLRTQLASRYIYEHLFLARLHLQGDDPRRFFQLVRSTTPPGQTVDVIATRRPFDDPGPDPFYYRLQPITETIVHKEHLVYGLGPDRMARYRQLFLEPDWSLDTLPTYGEAEGGNPFSTFALIPPRSRYQFLLDDALFFVRSFIRGPVCHGETAVDVIEDRFWVSFLDPDADLSVTDPSFLIDGAQTLELPVTLSDGGTLEQLQGFSHRNQVQYLEFRDARYRDSAAHQNGYGYDAIWDGDGTNRNARITVFRHFDNAAALTGFHGGIPETAWVIDFPIFERIYYDLVAGFDVFGRIEHQLSTRLYMDELRMESEDNFLNFMPRGLRQKMHGEWYQGALAEMHTYWHRRRVDDSYPTGITFATEDPKREFLLNLLAQGRDLWAQQDLINRCSDPSCTQTDRSATVTALRQLANTTGDWVKYLPDQSILVIEQAGSGPQLFSLTHDKAHKNVAFLFHEAARREPQKDVLSILPGVQSSYPNLFFKIDQSQMDAFVQALMAMQTPQDWMDVVAGYGIRRTSPDFWQISDQIHDLFTRQDPVQAGILDLGRYKDPKPGDDPT